MHRRSFLRTLAGSTLGWVVSSSALAGIGLSADRLVAAPRARLDPDAIKSDSPLIKVVGIGGAGNQVLEQLMQDGSTGIASWISIDSNAGVMTRSHANIKLYFEDQPWVVSRHNPESSPADVEYGLDDKERAEIAEALAGADAVCMMAGLGGGTGTRLGPPPR